MGLKTMYGIEVIEKTRAYLDYVEEHLTNVKKAYEDVLFVCRDMPWYNDEGMRARLEGDVQRHDLSKFSAEEFTQYRENFSPVEFETANADAFNNAWEHHKQHNTHHHETLIDCLDVVHMVIDWTAMSYKFGDTAESYYDANKHSMDISLEHLRVMHDVFDRIAGRV